MPVRYHNRGSFVLRRRFRGVGAIRRASGTNDPKMFERLDRMLLTLYDQGRLDVLRRLQDHSVTPFEVWERFRIGRLDELPTRDVLPSLKERWDRWVQAADTSDANWRSRALSGAKLVAMLPAGATLADLPKALKLLREAEADHPRTFNLARAAPG